MPFLPCPRPTARLLARTSSQIIGKDIERVKVGGPAIGLPSVDGLGGGLYEIRSTIAHGKIEFRILFHAVGSFLLLLHAFKKTTPATPGPATPVKDIKLAENRWRKAKGSQP